MMTHGVSDPWMSEDLLLDDANMLNFHQEEIFTEEIYGLDFLESLMSPKIEKEESADTSYQDIINNGVSSNSSERRISLKSPLEPSSASSSDVPLNKVSHDDPVQVTTSIPSQNSALPCNIDWPGDYNFFVSLEANDSHKMKNSWCYNEQLNKLYVGMETLCPFHVTLKSHKLPPLGSIIRAMPFYSSPQHSREPVTRCPYHTTSTDSTNTGFPHVEHLIRSDNRDAEYHTDATSQRHSVTTPYYPPSKGAESSLYLYKFMCLSSCNGGISRRPLQVIFTLEHGGHVLGRRAIDVRICACPKRDYKNDKNSQPHVSSTKTKAPLHTDAGHLPPKKPCLESGDPGPFTLKVQHKEDFELLKKVRDALEFKRFGPSSLRC